MPYCVMALLLRGEHVWAEDAVRVYVQVVFSVIHFVCGIYVRTYSFVRDDYNSEIVLPSWKAMCNIAYPIFCFRTQ